MGKKKQQPDDTLREKGLKITPARQIMLGLFRTRKNRLLTTGEIYDLVRKKQATINFSTVYRNLEIFVQNCILEKIDLECGPTYKLFEADLHRHHMICSSCHKALPLPYCPLKELEATLEKEESGFLPTDHRVEIFGICKDCRDNK